MKAEVGNPVHDRVEQTEIVKTGLTLFFRYLKIRRRPGSDCIAGTLLFTTPGFSATFNTVLGGLFVPYGINRLRGGITLTFGK